MLTFRVVGKRSMHANEVRPRTNKRGVDLISDALPFGRQRMQFIAPHAPIQFITRVRVFGLEFMFAVE